MSKQTNKLTFHYLKNRTNRKTSSVTRSPPGLDDLHHLQALKHDLDFLLHLDMIHMGVTIHRSGVSVGFSSGPVEFYFERCWLRACTVLFTCFSPCCPAGTRWLMELGR